jgi:Planctomycete cytochrome C
MKTKSLALLAVSAVFLFIYSCKHEPQFTQQFNDTPVGGNQPCSPDTVYFQSKVLPLLISSCAKVGCHDPVTAEEGLVLNSYSNIMRTGKIRPGDPLNSDIYKKMIDGDPNDRMPPPPDAALTTAQKDIIFKWIAQGAQNNACQDCDTATAPVQYSLHIAPLMQTHCVGCHSGTTPAGNIHLSSYNYVKSQVTSGKLYGSISHTAGFSAMPKNGGKLPDCKITLVKKWIDAGATNN